jgi:hypothetical protein
MMLMPVGPPAMILVALTDVVGAPEQEKLAIAKFLTVSAACCVALRNTYTYVCIGQLRYYAFDMFRCCRKFEGNTGCGWMIGFARSGKIVDTSM